MGGVWSWFWKISGRGFHFVGVENSGSLLTVKQCGCVDIPREPPLEKYLCTRYKV